MADQWYGVIDASGNLVSSGTVIADAATLAQQGLTVVTLSAPPDADHIWDTTQKAFVALQQIDRIQDFISHAGGAWSTLTAAQQTAVQTALVAILGNRRYRNQNQSVAIQ
jgi:hypothetical protein